MYSECLTCPKLGISCDGPNFAVMPADELLKWCRKRKENLRLSNAQLAEMSGVPKGTIDRLLSSTAGAFNFETIRPLLRALIGGNFNGNPCGDPPEQAQKNYEEMIEFLQRENQRLRDHVTEARANYQKTIDQMHAEAESHDIFLRGQIKDQKISIIILATVMALALGTIITALVIDMFNPNIGFFWLDSADAIYDRITEVITAIANYP